MSNGAALAARLRHARKLAVALLKDRRAFVPGLLGATVPSPASLAVVTQPTQSAVYQRTSTTGGVAGLGMGTVPASITLSAASVVYFQLRDAIASGNPVLEYGVVLAPAGTSTIQVPVSARLGQVFLDLGALGNTLTPGTTAFAMGHVTAVAGQSWIARWMHNYGAPGDASTTLASLGLTTAPAGCSACLLFGDASTTPSFTPAWGPPVDGTIGGTAASAPVINGAGPSQYMKVMAAALGVSIGVVGFGNGQTAIANWQPGQPSYVQLKGVLQQAGVGFATLIWMQGHSDSQYNTSNAIALSTALSNHVTALTTFLTQVRTDFPGQAATMVIGTVPDIATTYWGSTPQIDAIRAAGMQVAANISAGVTGVLAGATAVSCNPQDIAITQQDNTHPLMTGSITLSNHWARAALGLLGATTDGDLGPVLAGTGTRPAASKVITLPVSLVGGTALTAVGPSGFNAANQFYVHNQGDPTRPYVPASVAFSGANVLLTLADLPPDAQALSVRYRYGVDTAGAANVVAEQQIATGIYDNDTADGITSGGWPANTPAIAAAVLGRQLRCRTGEIVIAAPGGSTAYAQSPMAMSGAAYDTSKQKFGSAALSGGYGYISYGALPNQGSATVECQMLLASAPSGTGVAAGGGYLWFGSDSSGNLIIGAGGTIYYSKTSVVSASMVHAALVYNAGNNTVMAFYNGAIVPIGTSANGTLTNSIAVNGFFSQAVTSLGARCLTASGGYGFTGEIDELAVWNTAKYTAAFAPPSAAYAGTESGLLRVYHFDGTGN